jgi:hypothetical protein
MRVRKGLAAGADSAALFESLKGKQLKLMRLLHN